MAQDTLGRKNQLFWNEHAKTLYSEDWARKVSAQVKDLLESNVNWIEISKSTTPETPVKLLDYACGFGVVSTTLFDHADVIRGIDVSDTMVEFYNGLARQLGVSAESMHAVQGNLLDVGGSGRVIDGPDFFEADAIIMTMALHHIGDRVGLLSEMVRRLKTGGVLVVVDWLVDHATSSAGNSQFQASDLNHNHGHGHGHEDDHAQMYSTISRAGFSEPELLDIFTKAGCEASSFGLRAHTEESLVPEHRSGVKGGLRNRLFIAKGKKAGSSLI